MATLEEVFDVAPDSLTGITNSIASIDSNIANLEELKDEIIFRILWVTRTTVVDWIEAKVADLIANDPDANGSGPILAEYDYVLDATFWNGQTSQPVGTILNLQDWQIRKRTRTQITKPWGSWVTVYDWSNIVSDDVTEVITASEQFDYGWDYIIQDPIDQDGTYGINANIDALNIGKTILEYDKAKVEDSLNILPAFL